LAIRSRNRSAVAAAYRCGVREQARELLPAHAPEQVARAQRLLHDIADRAQDVVAGGMTVTAIDGFEVVEIERDERGGLPVDRCPAGFAPSASWRPATSSS
jgi:hypothetical protein